jgi:hypothetical protein
MAMTQADFRKGDLRHAQETPRFVVWPAGGTVVTVLLLATIAVMGLLLASSATG